MRNWLPTVCLLMLGAVPFCRANILREPPAVPDAGKRYLIYLHGAILTGTDGKAVSADFGAYEYEAILERFSRAGFEVISEVRGNDDVPQGARHIEDWIRSLKQAGVPSSQIAVVGASMGGIIAGRVSHQLQDRSISYVLVASLYQMTSLPPVPLGGRVLSIHDSSDVRTWVDDEYLVKSPALTESKVIVTQTGRGHGLLYRADNAWILPALDWLSRSEQTLCTPKR